MSLSVTNPESTNPGSTSPGSTHADDGAGAIKARLDALLDERHRIFPQKNAATGRALEQYFAGYRDWLVATQNETFTPDPRLTERARELTQRPIFICGHAKSGTSLLVNLLDGHPALVTMPGDSHAVHVSQQYAANTSTELDAWRFYWLTRLINPTGQKPFWLLGTADEPYATFWAYLHYWRAECAGQEAAPFLAVVLAYFCANPQRPDAPTAWVAKTPANEYRVETLLRQYPTARFLHVVRNPFANLVSMKRLSTFRSGRAYTLRSAYRIRHSMAQGVRNQKQLGGERYRFIQYEDLVADPEASLRDVAAWLDIAFDESLLSPTVNGLPATANSMKRTRAHRGEVHNNNQGWADELTVGERLAARLLFYGWERLP